MRLKLHLRNVQIGRWGIFFTFTWKIMNTSTLTISLKSSKSGIPKKMLDRLNTRECQDFRLFVHYVHQAIFCITWRRWNISISGFEPECQNQREGKLGPLQSLNGRGCTFRLLLLTDLFAISQWLAICQYQRWDSFCIQRLRTQSLLWPHGNSKEWSDILGSKMKFGVCSLLFLINWQKIVV